jgi:hypothetical protein
MKKNDKKLKRLRKWKSVWNRGDSTRLLKTGQISIKTWDAISRTFEKMDKTLTHVASQEVLPDVKKGGML